MPMEKFYKNSLILTASNLVTGVIGFIFSIILSRELGPEGLGLYSLIMPVYILLLCITSDGLITAISKISTVFFNKKDFKNLDRSVHITFYFMLIWSLGVAIIAFVSSSLIGTYIVKDVRSINVLKIICPALIFVALSSIFKGYFYGIGQYLISSLIDMSEKIIRVVLLLGSIKILALYTIRTTVSAAFFALTVGEFISFILLYIFFKRYSQKNKDRSITVKSQRRLQLLFNVLVISCPLCLNGFISSLFNTASALILPLRLMHAGIPYEAALSLIGKFSGMALNVAYLPFMLIGSMITVLVPDLSLSQSKKDYWAVEDRILKVLRISFLVGISNFIINLTIPDVLGQLFYNRNDLDNYIKFASIASLISYVSSPTFGILNGLGKQNIILRNSIIISIQSLIFIFILAGISTINIYGYGITMIITSVTAMLLNLHEIKKIAYLKLPVAEVLVNLLVGIFSYFMVKIFIGLIPDSLLIVKAVGAFILAFSLVFSISGLLKTFGKREF